MPKHLPKIIAIVGPTASGKSDLAVLMARKWNGEIISTDSRQVYKGLDIGTGKITKREMRGVSHYLLDVENPQNTFTVADFKQLADKAIAYILSRGKVPILCGGTGFYIDAVADNLILPEVKPNPRLRASLDKKSAASLFTMLSKLDPRRAKEIDSHNKVRLIRAIEIAKALGKVPKIKSRPIYNTLYIGIDVDREVLDKRIKTRLLKRIKTGMIKEVERLHAKGLSWRRMHELGLEYRYLALYLRDKISKSEMIERLGVEIRQYAKRQMTWFKRNSRIRWIDPKDTEQVSTVIQKFLK